MFSGDVDRAWRAFVDERTPAIVALVQRSGVHDRDEAMEVYTLVCERLAEDDCMRLRRWDPAKGRLGAWLAVLVRRVMVDWVRSRAGRRRLFGAVQQLDPRHQQVFQLYYWNDRTPSEIAEELSVAGARPVGLVDVLAALDAIHDAMTERHFRELVSMTSRSKPPVSLEAEFEEGRIDPPDPGPAADVRLAARERDVALDAALAALPDEDAAIVRLHYFQGLSLADVRRALHLPELSRARLGDIIDALKSALVDQPAAATNRAVGGQSA